MLHRVNLVSSRPLDLAFFVSSSPTISSFLLPSFPTASSAIRIAIAAPTSSSAYTHSHTDVAPSHVCTISRQRWNHELSERVYGNESRAQTARRSYSRRITRTGESSLYGRRGMATMTATAEELNERTEEIETVREGELIEQGVWGVKSQLEEVGVKDSIEKHDDRRKTSTRTNKTASHNLPTSPLPSSSLPSSSKSAQVGLNQRHSPEREAFFQHLRHLPDSVDLTFLQSLRLTLKKNDLLATPTAVYLVIAAMIKHDEYSSGLRLLKEADRSMQKVGTKLQDVKRMYESVMTILNRGQKWHWLVKYSDASIRAGVVSEVILRRRVRALVEVNHFAEVTRTFQLFAHNDIVPNTAVYDDVVMSHLLNADLIGAEKYLAEKSERGYSTTVRTCLALLDGMRAFGGNKMMEEKILGGASGRFLRERDSVIVLNRIMSVRAERGHLDDALDVLEYYNLSLLHTPLSLPSRSVVINATPEIKPTLSNLHRPPPDIATFTILIGLALRYKNYDCALTLCHQSQLAGLGLNEHLLAAFVRTMIANGSIHRAKRLVFQLDRGNARLSPLSPRLPQLEPTALVYHELWRGVLKAEGIGGATRLLKRIQEQGKMLEVTDGLVTALVAHLAVTRMMDMRLSANLIVRVANLTAGARRATIGDLNLLLKSAWRQERVHRLRPHQASSLPSASSLSNIPTAVVAPLTASEISSWETVTPSLPSTSTSLLALPAQAGHISFPTSITRIQSSLFDRGIAPDPTTIQQVLRRDGTFRSVGAMSTYLSTELIDRSIRPTYRHFAIIMRAHFRIDDSEGARETMQRAIEMGIEPHVAWYSILVGGYAKAGQRDKAREAYREMIARGLSPDRWMYITLAFGMARRGNVTGVEEILKEASERLNLVEEEWRNDPSVVSIQYRAFVSADRLLEAQELIRDRLAAGKAFRPDYVIARILHTTGRWIQWKLNRRQALTRDDDFQEMMSVHRANVVAVKKALDRENVPEQGNLKRLTAYWDGLKGRKKKGGEGASASAGAGAITGRRGREPIKRKDKYGKLGRVRKTAVVPKRAKGEGSTQTKEKEEKLVDVEPKESITS